MHRCSACLRSPLQLSARRRVEGGDPIVLHARLFVYSRQPAGRIFRLDTAAPQGGRHMKRWLAGLIVLLSPSAFAQQAPEIPYDSVANLLKLPPDMHLGEAAGVAVNSKGHIFVYSRGGSSRGPAYGNTASQILEFDRNGVFLREIG